MGVTAYLDATELLELHVAEDADFGNLLQQVSIIPQGAYGRPRVTMARRSETRTMQLPIVIDAEGEGEDGDTDADVAAATLSAVTRLLAKPCELYLLDSGQSQGVTIRTLPSPGPKVPTTRAFGNLGLLRPTLEIVCESYAYGDVQTLVDEVATAFPGAVDLAAMEGEYETPLTWALVLPNMTQVFLGLLEEEYTWTGWLLDANDLTWDTGANTGDGNAHGALARKTVGGATMSVEVETAAFPRGEYAMLARCRMTSGAGVVSCGSIGTDVALTSMVYKWLNLGRIVCPTRRVNGAGSAPALIELDPTLTADMWCDQVAFVRASAGYAEYDGVAMDSLSSDGEHIYVDGRVDYRYCEGGVLYPLRGHLHGIVEVNGYGSSFSPLTTLSCESRHNLWR
jgi:hypothetical protein